MSSEINRAEKQVGAIVAKTMEALEAIEAMRTLHPLEFDQVRRAVITAMWSTYTVGLKFGKRVTEQCRSSIV